MSSGMPTALVALLLVILGIPAGALAGTAPPAAPGDVGPPGPASDPVPQTANGTTTTPNGTALEQVNSSIEIAIQPNGDARWHIATSFYLRTDDEVNSFQSLATAFENGESAGLGYQAFERSAAIASAATDRQMAISEPLRTATLPSDTPGTATLTLAFTWSNFAQSDNGTVVVGDAFDTDPLWLKGLEPSQELRLRPPEDWEIVESPGVPLRDRALVWEGPAEFDGDDISATFGSGQGGTGTTGTDDGDAGAGGLLLLGGGGLLVLLAALIAYLLLRRSDGAAEDAGPAAPAAEADEDAADADASAAESAAAAAQGAEAESATGDTDEDVEAELLSDEERIEKLLEENGGRMKQANIVKETGWSNAKVSQLLSSMDEADRIDKLRIGRENLISFPEEDVTDAQE